VAERGWCLRAEEYLAIAVATACLPVAAPIACSAADRCRVACRCMCECLWYSGRPTLGDGVTVRADGVRLWPVGWLVVVSCMGLGHMTTCIKKFLGILSIQTNTPAYPWRCQLAHHTVPRAVLGCHRGALPMLSRGWCMRWEEADEMVLGGEMEGVIGRRCRRLFQCSPVCRLLHVFVIGPSLFSSA
jgi:hypothetical protein